jgi:phosphatidylglycerol---prolipoprotein diacylglyceryl transferase
MNLAYIPSPGQGVWHIGFFPIRGYALCIIAGVIVAVLFGDRRWVQRGGEPGAVGDIAIWAVPFGLVGGRLYHVLTDPELYFGTGRHPVDALYIWRGGLGIWGAIALGAVGAYIGCRRRGIRFSAMADALAPGVALAQAVGRWGNWFNQELYGKPTTLPWGLKIDPAHRTSLPDKYQQYSTFHPTYLYESIWDIGVALVVLWADRRFKLGYGRVLALYVMCYTAGRGWIEYLRIDTANHIFGVRLNVWTSIILFIAATAYFVLVGRRHQGREPSLYTGRDDSDAATVAVETSAANSGDDGEPTGPSTVPPP